MIIMVCPLVKIYITFNGIKSLISRITNASNYKYKYMIVIFVQFTKIEDFSVVSFLVGAICVTFSLLLSSALVNYPSDQKSL